MAEANVDVHGEEWRPVPGFDGAYAASTLGRLKRIKKRGWSPAGHIFSPHMNKQTGYRTLVVFKGEKQETWLAHRLVALAFLGPPPDGKPCIDHINGIKDDNRPENLRWCSVSENSEFMRARRGIRRKVSLRLIQTCRCGERAGKVKLTWRQVEAIRQMNTQGLPSGWKTKIAAEYGVAPSAISKVLRPERWVKNPGQNAPDFKCNSVASFST